VLIAVTAAVTGGPVIIVAIAIDWLIAMVAMTVGGPVTEHIGIGIVIAVLDLGRSLQL
jgi:hypothetical protein